MGSGGFRGCGLYSFRVSDFECPTSLEFGMYLWVEFRVSGSPRVRCRSYLCDEANAPNIEGGPQ